MLGLSTTKNELKEEEIYDILYKKKEINDKTPKLRTEDEKKKLKNLSYKIRKFADKEHRTNVSKTRMLCQSS